MKIYHKPNNKYERPENNQSSLNLDSILSFMEDNN